VAEYLTIRIQEIAGWNPAWRLAILTEVLRGIPHFLQEYAGKTVKLSL
jgi:hypothetical protein